LNLDKLRWRMVLEGFYCTQGITSSQCNQNTNWLQTWPLQMGKNKKPYCWAIERSTTVATSPVWLLIWFLTFRNARNQSLLWLTRVDSFLFSCLWAFTRYSTIFFHDEESFTDLPTLLPGPIWIMLLWNLCAIKQRALLKWAEVKIHAAGAHMTLLRADGGRTQKIFWSSFAPTFSGFA
jgi:hypothetical protein